VEENETGGAAVVVDGRSAFLISPLDVPKSAPSFEVLSFVVIAVSAAATRNCLAAPK